MSASRPPPVYAADAGGALPAARDGAPGPREANAPSRPTTTLEGSLERITFTNEEAAWSVVRVVVHGRKDPITAVGNLLGAQPGESLRLTGWWVQDRKYGEQFRVDSFATVKPATLVGIEKYLGSGLVKGVGPAMAKRLVAHFGLETLEVIDSKPERLAEVKGFGEKRRKLLCETWAEQRDIRQVMVFLQSHEVPASFAVKVYKQYGAQSIEVVQNNPYRLAIDVYGIGFRTADRIAQSLGVPSHSPKRAEAGVLQVLREFSEDGHLYAPRDKLTARTVEMLEVTPELVEAAITRLAAAEYLAVEGASALAQPRPEDACEAVYLKALHVSEVGVANLLKALAAWPGRPLEVDVERAMAWFEGRQGISLAPEQKEAVRQAMVAKVLVITGGPGTGKTTLVNAILSILEKKGRKLLLSAPTGRAAKRMGEATGREAETIHRLLEYNPRTHGFLRDRNNPLDADMLVLDEVSMVDTVLMLNVLKALPPHCQLLLVGDVDQLPSVGPGSVLQDIIASGHVPVVRLKHIFRQAQASLIITNAHRINQGELPQVPPADALADFYFVEKEEPEAILAALKTLVKERIPRRFGFHPVDEVQVLVPMNRGLIGTSNLNAVLQEHLNPSGEDLARGSRTFRVGDKVMQVRNNYELGVFNGDIGRVEAIDKEEQSLVVLYDGRPVAYSWSDLDELVLAYATSVHKSQGSEYPCVVLPLHTQHYMLLQRNLLYTGVTRGKKLVVLVGSKKALGLAVRNGDTQKRFTRLAARLRD
ncbi:ATP-dependent RecD-like DNA helicase [Pyxidicoccus trucidator]|uniref:SF1B family DNA helicase RecD2 n=1 Tax=Pyxidicoccus trucidator TaxID=2709662 RepID=UPI0013DD4990|nr:ATP-dependent RecD-like DNA helicase [Pyxidicoccus trucidator]